MNKRNNIWNKNSKSPEETGVVFLFLLKIIALNLFLCLPISDIVIQILILFDYLLLLFGLSLYLILILTEMKLEAKQVYREV